MSEWAIVQGTLWRLRVVAGATYRAGRGGPVYLMLSSLGVPGRRLDVDSAQDQKDVLRSLVIQALRWLKFQVRPIPESPKAGWCQRSWIPRSFSNNIATPSQVGHTTP